MKRFVSILLSLLLIAVCAISFADEVPLVTMENVREHSGYVWRKEIPHYNGAVEQGFRPLAMDPAEAFQRLRDAYDRGQDDATRELLQSWGIEMEPCGAPVLRELISQADLQHHENSDISTENVPLVQLISFSGWGWGEEGTLIFVEQWSDWYLWDYMPCACEDFRLCGTDHGTIVYLEFSMIGHGTGCYVRCMDVYHLQTRKIEAGYTTYGYEVYQDSGIQAYGSACYARDGVHIFRQLSPLAFDETQNEYVPTGVILDVFDYGIDEQGHLERRE
ncbi:MAG: hypothetical protein IJK28_08730 [Clostridia bacterium]|nr:hypothetical protein [Clostridia bacterium]